MKDEVVKVISENPYKGTQMVVVQRTITGRTNRLGKPYKVSRTEHRKIPKVHRVETDE